MSVFQLGELPTGFVYNENGGFIHHRYGLLLAIPQPNQDPLAGQTTGPWGNAYFSLASSWADVRLRVQFHDGTSWLATADWDVNQGNGRSAGQLPKGIQKIHVGRVKKNASDTVDDNPVSWLLEYVKPKGSVDRKTTDGLAAPDRKTRSRQTVSGSSNQPVNSRRASPSTGCGP
jgi:hypothetical protein